MRFDPCCFFLLCDRTTNSSAQHSLILYSDQEFAIYVPAECNIDYPKFLRNILYCCSPLGDKLPQWAVMHQDVNIVFHCSLASFAVADIIQIFKTNYSEIHNQTTLQIVDCSVNEFIDQPRLDELFSIFSSITILNETADGKLLKEYVSSEHRSRRRPCRYPFESVTMDFNGNVFQCPYCEKVLTGFTDYSSILKDPAILNFLAAQLLADVNLFPQCANCPYWIDGWLGEEKGHIQNKYGDYFNLVWEGHSCSIKRRKSK